MVVLYTSKEYSSCFDEVMRFWRLYHEEYVKIIPEYKRLLRMRREKKIQPLNKLTKDVLGQFPRIELLEIQDPLIAEDYLIELTYPQLKSLLVELENYKDGYVVNTIRAKIADYKYQIKNPRPTSSFALDPDYGQKGRRVVRPYRRYMMDE